VLPAGLAFRAATTATRTTATAASGTATAAPTTRSTESAASLLRPGFVHAQPTSLELLLIERLAGSLTLTIVVHLNEGEAARSTRGVVTNNVHGVDSAMLGEELLELWLVRGIGEVAYEDSHRERSFWLRWKASA
jgi:hypothetical protein